jgi:hypothetical protein
MFIEKNESLHTKNYKTDKGEKCLIGYLVTTMTKKMVRRSV